MRRPPCLGLRQADSNPLHPQVCTKSAHAVPTPEVHSSTARSISVYTHHVRQATPTSTTRHRNPFTPKQKKWVQEVVGTFLYYGRQVDGTMLAALSAIGAAMTNADIETVRRYITHFLDYAASNPDAKKNTSKVTCTFGHIRIHLT